MLEVTPYGRLHININETLTGLQNIQTRDIKSINTPSVITFGQNDRLKELSVGIDDLIKKENEIINKYSPYELKQGITLVSYIVYTTAFILVLFIIRTIYKKYKRHVKKNNTRNNISHRNDCIVDL